MQKNVGTGEQIVRMVVGLGMIGGALIAPWPLTIGLLTLGAPGAMLFLTGATGRCPMCRMMGRTSCPVPR